MKIYTAVNGAGETLAVSDRLYDVTKAALEVVSIDIGQRIFHHIKIFEGETPIGAVCTTEVNGHVTARFVEEKPKVELERACAQVLKNFDDLCRRRSELPPEKAKDGDPGELPKPEQPSEIQRINEQWRKRWNKRDEQVRELFRIETDQWHRRWRTIQELMERAKTLVNFDLKNAIYPDSRREFEEYRTVIAGAIEYIESVARDELP